MATDRSFATECPVCLEDLFDEDGRCPDEGGVANITCRHLIHSRCLTPTASALNSDGSRYGVGAYGNNAGCPICQTGASLWTSSRQAAFFPSFWLTKVEAFLLDRGPVVPEEGGKRAPVPARLVREAMRNDGSFSDEQKTHIGADPVPTDLGGLGSTGLAEALHWGGSRDYSIARVIWSSSLTSKGIWRYDKFSDDIWLWEWDNLHPREKCAACGGESSEQPSRRLMRCARCAESSENAWYCSRECQRADWSKHKRGVCKHWQDYGPNGSKRPQH